MKSSISDTLRDILWDGIGNTPSSREAYFETPEARRLLGAILISRFIPYWRTGSHHGFRVESEETDPLVIVDNFPEEIDGWLVSPENGTPYPELVDLKYPPFILPAINIYATTCHEDFHLLPMNWINNSIPDIKDCVTEMFVHVWRRGERVENLLMKEMRSRKLRNYDPVIRIRNKFEIRSTDLRLPVWSRFGWIVWGYLGYSISYGEG